MNQLKKMLGWLTVAGNLFFILWIWYNGINENFEGTTVEKLSWLLLTALLASNTLLLLGRRRVQSA